MKLVQSKTIGVLILIGLAYSCRKEVFISDDSIRPDGWTTETHSNDVAPNYEVVFEENGDF